MTPFDDTFDDTFDVKVDDVDYTVGADFLIFVLASVKGWFNFFKEYTYIDRNRKNDKWNKLISQLFTIPLCLRPGIIR